jgi:RNA recognition motif-containing protein
MEKTKIFIGGVPRTSTESEVREVFEPFGTIRDLYLIPNRLVGREGENRGFGFLEFVDTGSACAAIDASIEGGIVLEGHTLHCDWAREKTPVD